MKTSNELWAQLKQLETEQAAAVEAEDLDGARIIQGRIEAVKDQLEEAIADDDALRDGFKAPKAEAATLAEAALGMRDEFSGLEVGYKFHDAGEPTVTWTAGPAEADTELTAKGASLFAGFASTLRRVPAIGSVSFKQRIDQVGEPGTWGGVTEGASAEKAAIVYQWKDAVANKETIAGYVPVSKDSLRDYDELYDIIESDLALDVDEVEDKKMVNGTNQSGIVGILNTTGIQTFTTPMGGAYYDAIRMMITLVKENARRTPTHVCVSPAIKQAIDLHSTDTGFYQQLTDFWGLDIVEDSNIDGILVYDANAARIREIHDRTVEVGYVNDQFAKNELSILCEKSSALQVRIPGAFCYASKATLDSASDE